MYNQFFGLRKDPFNLTPDPEFLYLTEQHREALAAFTYAILARKGFVVLTGDAGTGKTTLLTRALRNLPTARVQSSVIVNPTLTPAEFLEAALLDFGITDIPASKAQRIARLQSLLWKGHNAGKVSALIIDEAHKLSADVLEEIRLLGNFESAEVKLLQIALIGQTELDDLLNRDQMRQFKQRIALRASIAALMEGEVENYIRHRWMKAGGIGAPFSKDALAGIGQVSKGIPRVINVLCDNALIQAFGEGSSVVEAQHVQAACQDLHFSTPVSPTKPIRAPEAPAEVPVVPPLVDTYPMRTLERYNTAAGHPSLRTRLATKLGFNQRIETA
jgi:general secretion pathway protein A